MDTTSSLIAVGDTPVALKLPDETWIQILKELETYKQLKDAGRICKKLQNFIKGSDFDKALFRSPPPVKPLRKGGRTKLHPMLDVTQGIFGSLDDALIIAYESEKEEYFPKDYPSILENEFATSPASTEITFKFCEDAPSPTFKSLVNPSGVKVGEFLNHVAEYWSTPVTGNQRAFDHAREEYGVKNKKDVKYIHCLGARNGWDCWFIKAKGENCAEVRASDFDS
ncbi:hypothetical protein JCM5350_001983 [Sporobolomyces pararoseus]